MQHQDSVGLWLRSILHFTTIVAGLAFFWIAAAHPDLFEDLNRKDSHEGAGLVENLTVLVLLPAIAWALMTVVRWRSPRPMQWIRLWLTLWTLACVYFAGEECSWGQWYFGWSTPEVLATLNDQGETNLHNTKFVARPETSRPGGDVHHRSWPDRARCAAPETPRRIELEFAGFVDSCAKPVLVGCGMVSGAARFRIRPAVRLCAAGQLGIARTGDRVVPFAVSDFISGAVSRAECSKGSVHSAQDQCESGNRHRLIHRMIAATGTNQN